MQAPVDNAGEPAVGEERHVLAPGQVTERGGDLRGLLHAGSRRPRADQHDDVALAHGSCRRSLDRLDRVVLVGEHPRRTAMPIDAVGVDHRRVDGGRLDDRPLRREVAERKDDRAGESGAARRVRRHDDLIRIDGRRRREPGARRPPPLARFPPVERGVERVAGGREHAPVQQPHAAEMQHHFRHAAGHEHLGRRETARSVRQRVHQARRRAIDPDPVLDRGRLQPRGGGDRRNVQQQIRGAAERGMDEHRVLDGGSR